MSKTAMMLGLGILVLVPLTGWPISAIQSGSWTNGATWGGTAPVAGDQVTIGAGFTVTADVSTVSLNSLNTLGTLVFSGWDTVITAATVAVGGTITHRPQSDISSSGGWVPDARVALVCSTLTVLSGGAINASGKGYAGGVSGDLNGRGPAGGGSVNHSGGYGGFGGDGNGVTYGSTEAPADPGSGGGGWNTERGGNGGGVIWIEAADRAVVNGTISANGDTGYGNNCGSGAGGSVYIHCGVFDGTGGVLSAKGGDRQTYSASSGGGGRIAVIYTNLAAQAGIAVPSVRFSTAPGAESSVPSKMGDVGTLYFPDSRFLTEVVAHSGQWMAPGFTNWSVNNLTISNAWIRFTATDFRLTVTNSLVVNGGSDPLNRFELIPSLIQCGGNLVLTNGASLNLLASANSVPEADGCGPRVTVGGMLWIGTNCVLYPTSHPTNGCGIGFQMNNLTIARGGSINANVRGYRGGTNGTDHGKGPGGTLSSSFAGGAGYGGAGGFSGNSTPGGITYGSSNAPVHPGSGSGCSIWGTPYVLGKTGGGLVRLLVADRVVLDGSITANGAGPIDWSGGSSGGGIYIHCQKFSGAGSVSATGGASGPYHGGGGGGGGRIAIWRGTDTSALSSITAAGGASGAGSAGATGTIYWGQRSRPGTVVTIQ
jgi:hypothetical protein